MWILFCEVLGLQCIMDVSADEDHSSNFLRTSPTVWAGLWWSQAGATAKPSKHKRLAHRLGRDKRQAQQASSMLRCGSGFRRRACDPTQAEAWLWFSDNKPKRLLWSIQGVENDIVRMLSPCGWATG
ncbi:hypothetical protein ACFXTI_027065 [Malus domestica]